MFGILAKFFRFSGRENGNKFKLSIVIGLIEALASAMKIPAIMYILIGLMSGKPIGKYIGGSIAIMVIAIVVDVICKRYSTVLQTEGGYNASAFMRIKIAEHLRYLPMGYFNANSIGEISSITTNTMETLGDVAARVVMLTMQGILETSMIILMLFLFDWRIGLTAAYFLWCKCCDAECREKRFRAKSGMRYRACKSDHGVSAGNIRSKIIQPAWKTGKKIK